MAEAFSEDSALTDLTGFLLRVGHNLAQRNFQEAFGRGGISALQFSILMTVYKRPGITHSDLVAAVYGTKTILTTALKPLVAQGLVLPQRDRQDHRMVRYGLTAQASGQIPDLVAKIKQSEAQVEQALSVEEVRLLRGLLRRLAQIDPPV